MTLFFNLTYLEEISKGNPKIFLSILKSYYNKELPNKHRIKYNKDKLKGSSFLLNPKSLFHKSNIDVSYIVQYVILAAKRDYFLYSQYRIKSLNLSFYPDLDLSKIKTNPLLKITSNEIFFLYEEV